MFKYSIKIIMSLLLAVTVLFAANPSSEASAETTAADAVVYVGQTGADMYEQSINGVLYTEQQIGFMADRILWTEEQIGFMADRIVYVTELSQDNSIEIIYIATALWQTGTQDGGYLYEVSLMPVAMLPTGW
ncbi:hypothetical protein [Pseudalkalibacillus caeni]|uniref:Uncharacterized protein n=1 Tax=Exobacillus caeni TaxID=2574798 RepID=A0A5R9F451_9BACL|nr:hypothetical protein [Pseudalkalibacillus caeni]TLS37126.1 hypothetical protein FCL54_11400 [Pseudalkalibacillus caeni]